MGHARDLRTLDGDAPAGHAGAVHSPPWLSSDLAARPAGRGEVMHETTSLLSEFGAVPGAVS